MAANGKETVEDTFYPDWGQGPDGNDRNVMGILQLVLSKELDCLEMKAGLTSSQMYNTKSAQLQNSYMTPSPANKYYQAPNEYIHPTITVVCTTIKL